MTSFEHQNYLLFHELITALCSLFPELYFDVTKVSGVTERTPEAYKSRKNCVWSAVVTDCFYVWCELLMTHYSVLEIKCKSTRKCVVYWVLPPIYI